MDIQILVVLTCHDDKKITDSVEIIQSWADHNNVKSTHQYDKVQTKHVPCGTSVVSAKRMDMLLIGPAGIPCAVFMTSGLKTAYV